MSSATVSLFASVALAAAGAAGLAYSLSHPGLFKSVAEYTIAETGLSRASLPAKTNEPAYDEAKEDDGPPGTVSIAAGAYGHFQTQAEIDGRPVDVMVDTGASLVALTYEDAASVGIYVKPSDFTEAGSNRQRHRRASPRSPFRASASATSRCATYPPSSRSGARPNARCSECRSWAGFPASKCAPARLSCKSRPASTFPP